MYILLAGGVLNTVLVPQLVRAVRRDSDGGEAYTNRVMTVGLVGLAIVSVLLTLAVPLVVRLYSGPGWKAPGLEAQYASMTVLAYWCMPQVFFYGVHVLAGQVLNARDRFGPMMWAPIANNVVSLAVLGVFALVFGQTRTDQAFTTGQEVVLGPRRHRRHRGAGGRAGPVPPLGGLPLPAPVRPARDRARATPSGWPAGPSASSPSPSWRWSWSTGSPPRRPSAGAGPGSPRTPTRTRSGSCRTRWSRCRWRRPCCPSASRLGAAGDLRGVAAETTRTIRLAVAVLLPVAVGLVALGLPAAQLAFGFGRGGADASFVGWALMALALGLVPFTVQYVLLRAFYALEDTRSTFFLQVVIAAVNVVAAVVIVSLVDDPVWVAAGLGLAYSLAYGVGVVVSFRRLRRTLTDLDPHELVRHCVRLLVAALPAAALAWVVCWAVTSRSGSRAALFLALVLAGVVAVATFLVVCRLLHLTEVTQITSVLRRRRAQQPAAARDPSTRWTRPTRRWCARPSTPAVRAAVRHRSAIPPHARRPAALTIDQVSPTPAAALDRGDESAANGRSEDDGMTQTALAPALSDDDTRRRGRHRRAGSCRSRRRPRCPRAPCSPRATASRS